MKKVITGCLLLGLISCSTSKQAVKKREKAGNIIALSFAATVIILVAGQYGKSVSP